MHEFGIIASLIDIVGEHARAHHAVSVSTVVIRIGQAVEAQEDALQFAFSALTQDDELLRHARLRVDMVPVKFSCKACHAQFQQSRTNRVCPMCSSAQTLMIQGKEIELSEIEMDVEEDI